MESTGMAPGRAEASRSGGGGAAGRACDSLPGRHATTMLVRTNQAARARAPPPRLLSSSTSTQRTGRLPYRQGLLCAHRATHGNRPRGELSPGRCSPNSRPTVATSSGMPVRPIPARLVSIMMSSGRIFSRAYRGQARHTGARDTTPARRPARAGAQRRLRAAHRGRRSVLVDERLVGGRADPVAGPPMPGSVRARRGHPLRRPRRGRRDGSPSSGAPRPVGGRERYDGARADGGAHRRGGAPHARPFLVDAAPARDQATPSSSSSSDASLSRRLFVAPATATSRRVTLR